MLTLKNTQNATLTAQVENEKKLTEAAQAEALKLEKHYSYRGSEGRVLLRGYLL